MSIFKQIRENPDYNVNNSVRWFRDNVTKSFKNLGTQQFLGQHLSQQTTIVKPGQMCFFGYYPKGADTLPYYDKFPLVLPFGADNKHFIGLNLHYMPPELRINLLDNLLHFSTDNKIPERIRLKMSWEMLKAFSKRNEVEHSVKKYLFGYVKTRFVVVNPQDWVMACFLPLSRFAKATEQQVWRDMR